MNALPNPYLGPRFFEARDRQYFFGRDSEIRILTGLVLARRVVLLFAKSGVGKSSLLRAGLIPQLTAEQVTVGRRRRVQRTVQRMTVLPIGYVGRSIASASTPNIFVQGLLLTLTTEASAIDENAANLVDGLAPLFTPSTDVMPEDDHTEVDDRPILLILDQFEELFTRHLDRRHERAALFDELNQALIAYPRLHLLFSMREDYIGELIPYADLLPDRMRSRFRLEPLSRAAALAAIMEPAAAVGRTFTDDAAAALIDNLSLHPTSITPALTSATDGLGLQEALRQGAAMLGGVIEPVHLQIVCRELWEKLPADRTEILVADLKDYETLIRR
ncbi:MAG: hypothetical protein R2932_50350 [Caldilineaceae bacterium]